MDITVPLPAEDPRGILPSAKQETSFIWNTSKPVETNLPGDAEDVYYAKCVATAGASFTRTKTSIGNEPRSIVWRVLQQSSILELDPVDLNLKSKVQLRKIRIHTPTPFISNCITVCENTDNGHIVIDFISESSYLYTITFSFTEFIINSLNSMSDHGHSLIEEYASNWRSIKYPYSFDLKKPHLLYAISHKELVVSTKEGLLVKMERTTTLGDISTFLFNDPSHTSGFSRLLSWGHSDRVPGNSGLSLRAAVSIISVPQANILVTLTIHRMLRVWSTKTLELIEEHELESSKDVPHQEKILIGPEPVNLLRIPTWKDQYKEIGYTHLCTYLPLGDGQFKTWQLNLDPSGNILSGLNESYNLVPQIPDTYSTWLVNDFHILHHSEKKQEFQISIMWKSNTSSVMYQAAVPFTPGQDITSYMGCETDDNDLQYVNGRNLSDDKTKFYLERIFGPDGYTNDTVETAIIIYGNNYAVKLYNPSEAESVDIALQDKVCQTVGTAVSLGYKSDGTTLDYHAYKSDLVQEWVRFDRLCAELQRQGNEVLSLGWDPVLELFWVVKASFVSIVRPALPIELCYSNKSSAPSGRISSIVAGSLGKIKASRSDKILRTLDALYTFRRSLSHIHFSQVLSGMIEDYGPGPSFDTLERMEFLYSDLLENQVSETAYEDLLSSLSGIGETDSILEFLHSSILTNFSTAETQGGFQLTTTGCGAVSKAFFEQLTTSRLVVADALLVLLATTFTATAFTERVPLYAKYLRLFKGINAIFDFMNITSSNTGAEIDDAQTKGFKKLSLNPSPTSHSQLPFFQNLILADRHNHFSSLVSRAGFSQVLNQTWFFWNVFEESSAAAKCIAHLLATNNVAQAQEMCCYLPIDSFSSFIKAQIFLKSGENGLKARTLLCSASVELGQRRLTPTELEIVRPIFSTFGVYSKNSFGNGISRFFLDASKTALACGMTICALELAKNAQTNLGEADAARETEKTDKENSNGHSNTSHSKNKIIELNFQVYNHLFETAIKASSYDDAYCAVTELALLNSNSEQDTELQGSTTNDNGDKIVPYIESLASAMTQSGNGMRLCQYPFIGLTNLVSDFFLKKAETALITATHSSLLSSSLSSRENATSGDDAFLYYRALYSWTVELHDFRGGEFISTKNVFNFHLTNLNPLN